jgi:electron transfer flavoprotein alpha subunit
MSCALVVVEHSAHTPRRACLEALGRVRELGLESIALVAGSDPAEVAGRIAPYAGLVLTCAHDALGSYDFDALAPVVANLISGRKPLLVLAPATLTGRDLLARLSARIGAAYAADVTAIDLVDGTVRMTRPVHGGKAFATIEPTTEGPMLATVRANAFAMPAPGDPGPVEALAVTIDAASLRTRVTAVTESSTGRVPLTEAEIVITGGRGLGDPKNFDLLEKLADRLGAAVGASRAVVDAGWREVSDQVGKSGNTVAPRLYVAFGVSGAIHHTMGMDGSGTVVVVNKDENAVFFKHADHGLVADALTVLPKLIEKLG